MGMSLHFRHYCCSHAELGSQIITFIGSTLFGNIFIMVMRSRWLPLMVTMMTLTIRMKKKTSENVCQLPTHKQNFSVFDSSKQCLRKFSHPKMHLILIKLKIEFYLFQFFSSFIWTLARRLNHQLLCWWILKETFCEMNNTAFCIHDIALRCCQRNMTAQWYPMKLSDKYPAFDRFCSTKSVFPTTCARV